MNFFENSTTNTSWHVDIMEMEMFNGLCINIINITKNVQGHKFT